MSADFKAPITIDGVHDAGAYFYWSQPTVGFGEFSFSFKDGKFSAESECMGREWSRRCLYALVDKICEEAFNEDGSPK